MQCCLEPEIANDFFYVKLSGASRIILHRVLTCAMLFQEY